MSKILFTVPFTRIDFIRPTYDHLLIVKSLYIILLLSITYSKFDTSKLNHVQGRPTCTLFQFNIITDLKTFNFG